MYVRARTHTRTRTRPTFPTTSRISLPCFIDACVYEHTVEHGIVLLQSVEYFHIDDETFQELLPYFFPLDSYLVRNFLPAALFYRFRYRCYRSHGKKSETKAMPEKEDDN